MQRAYKNRYPDPETHQIKYNYDKEEAKKMIQDSSVIGEEALNIMDVPMAERYNQFGRSIEFKDVDSFHLQSLLFNGQTQEYTYVL